MTGGTGVVGQSAVTELLRLGHTVRVLSRNADEVCRQWPEGVEAWPAAITDQSDLRGCAEGCDLVLHVAGIIEESPPENTYETVNVEGTRTIVREAERCKVGRFIYVSSLGADAGTSPYHRSKRRAEEIVRGFAGGWIILRPGNVYGPGDDVISLMLTMIRTLPLIPVVGGGDHEFQPIWVDDLAAAIGEAVRRTDLHGRVLELAGEERTSLNAVLDQLGEITGRTPTRVPIPTFLASAGVNMAGMLGVKVPLTESQLTMLTEGNWIRTPGTNALTGVFQISPTPLDSGLRKLADSLPEQTPDKGVGAFKRRRYWIDIAGSPLSAGELFARFRERFSEIVPGTMDLNAEPDTPKILEKGSTITMALPVRGNIQVRVEELTNNEAVLVTVAGHPMAGAVRFLCEQMGDALRFQVQLYDRPANIADWFLMRTIGETVQAQSWETMLESLIAESGGKCASGIQHEEELLDADKTERVEEWLRDLIVARKREHYAAATDA
ncbi:MAG TPA: NAD-dependent epimerase/dehydratase family protein, partial [Gemmatimonadaceae bacterium]|nr:NAD-dependent epimerase/dehydratase family protein [Gemmatimonadaceae bacterium]